MEPGKGAENIKTRTLDTWSRVQHFVEVSVAGGDGLEAPRRRLHRPRPSQMGAVRLEGVVGVVCLDYGTLFRVLCVYSETQREKEGGKVGEQAERGDRGSKRT